MTFISYAQNGEDVILWRALKHVENGFYIDVGACDPDDLSITKAFYERGWNGVNIEPVREYYELCAKNRPRDKNIQVAVTARSGISRFTTVKGTGLSTTVDVFATQAADKGWDIEVNDVISLSLADICAALSLREVHFLKIDVEGAERAVLEGADFEQVRPWIVVVEATAPLSTERSEHLWEHILLQAGYLRAFFDGLNLYYVAQEHSELIEALGAPANVLDDFKSVRAVEMEARHYQQERRIAHLAAEIAAQQSEHTAQMAAVSDQAAVLETELAQRDRILSELRARSAHQVTGATQRIAFANRKLAIASRRVLELEDRLHVQQQTLDELTFANRKLAIASRRVIELEDCTHAQQQTLDEFAGRVRALEASHEALSAEHTLVRGHRDALLRSTSWRISAPLRKAKTASQIVRLQPRLVLPLVAANLQRRPEPSLERVPEDVPSLISCLISDPTSDLDSIDACVPEVEDTKEIAHDATFVSQDTIVDQIRHGIRKRRLLSQ